MQKAIESLKPLPSTHFSSVEYPGFVRSNSVPLAITTLGGQSCLDTAFKRNTSKSGSLIELSLREENPFAHPIAGEVVPANNILLKIVKRRRRRNTVDNYAVNEAYIGEYIVEAVGVLAKTARFRSMADYQYQPDAKDPITKLRSDMQHMHVESIHNFRVHEEAEEYTVMSPETSNLIHVLDPRLSEPLNSLHNGNNTDIHPPVSRSSLRMFPPPVFSRQAIPLNYSYKANPASVVSTVVEEETGEERKRMINRMRWKGYGPASIAYGDEKVPDTPPSSVESFRKHVDGHFLLRLQALFVDRPIWTRMSLMNQFTPAEAREILNSKILLPLICYVFQDGPWRDTLVRLTYDPRKDRDARFYQRLYFRNANHPIERPSVVSRRQERSSKLIDQAMENDADRKNSHVFDGVTLTKETAAFQLCDITDPMLKEMIEHSDDLRDACDERDGWYSSHAFEQIKTVLRHKFFSLLEGYQASDEDCWALLNSSGGTRKSARTHRLQPRKHNMAKGALRPEDAAAVRLQATLDRNARMHSTQR